jgi:hypothetical protein
LPVTVVAAQHTTLMPARPASAEQRTGIRDLLDRLVEAGALPADPVSRADVVRHMVRRDDATIRNLTWDEAAALLADLAADADHQQHIQDAVVVDEAND